MAKKKASRKPSAASFVERSRHGVYSSHSSLKAFLPSDILTNYEVREWRNAGAVMAGAYKAELAEIVDVLRKTTVRKSWLSVGGGGKTKYAQSLDEAFKDSGWVEKSWETAIVVDAKKSDSPTHAVDCYKNGVALELEWNNKDPFFDRDLNNFRLLFDLRVIGVGVIITKSDELAHLLSDEGLWKKYGTSTTWMHKLIPRIEGGGGGGCPLLVFGIRKAMYVDDVTKAAKVS